MGLYNTRRARDTRYAELLTLTLWCGRPYNSHSPSGSIPRGSCPTKGPTPCKKQRYIKPSRVSIRNLALNIKTTGGAKVAGRPRPPPCVRARRAGHPQRAHHSVACTRGVQLETRPLARCMALGPNACVQAESGPRPDATTYNGSPLRASCETHPSVGLEGAMQTREKLTGARGEHGGSAHYSPTPCATRGPWPVVWPSARTLRTLLKATTCIDIQHVPCKWPNPKDNETQQRYDGKYLHAAAVSSG